MRNGFRIAPLILVLAACGSGSGAPQASGEASGAASVQASVLAADAETEPAEAPSEAPPPEARKVDVSNDLYEFAYGYPAAAAAIPALRAELDRRLDAAQGQLAHESRQDRNEARGQAYEYRPHGYEAQWQIVADLPGWLSLSASVYTYSGGAHGMTVSDTLLWDRRAEALRGPVDLFTSKDALRAALRTPFCDALDREREKRRGEPVDRASGDIFSECIDPLDQTLILGSSNGEAFDRIGVLVPPYNAGAYAEGSYEVTLPVTASVMKALKPQYRSAFAIP